MSTEKTQFLEIDGVPSPILPVVGTPPKRGEHPPSVSRWISPRFVELYMISKHFLNSFFKNYYFEEKTIIAFFIHIRHRSIKYNI